MRLIAEAARRFGDRPAFREGDRQLTWHEAAVEVDRRAAELRVAGAGPDGLWIWEGEPSIEGLLELLAILEVGALLIPINPRLSAAERDHLLSILPAAGVSNILQSGDVDRLGGEGTSARPAVLTPFLCRSRQRTSAPPS